MNPLRFGTTIVEAYRFVWDNRRDFFAFVYLPVLAISIFATVIDAVYPLELPRDMTGITAGLITHIYARLLMSLAVGLVMYVIFAVPWHRLQLIGGEGGTVGAALRWRPTHRRYLFRLFLMLLAYFVLLGLIVAATVASASGGGGEAAVSPVAVLIGTIAQVALLAQILRGGVLLAAIAVEDASVTLSETWRLTRRCSPVLLALFFAAMLPALIAGFVLIGQIVALIGAETLIGSLPLRFAVTLLSECISFFALAVLTTVFSIAYRDLKAQDAGTV